MKRRYLIIIIVAVVAFLGIFFGLFEFTSRPSFCPTCHYMKPYYESWKASKHSDVTCTKCHFPPGFKEYVKRKVIASAMVINYVMGTYSSPWAEIEDKSCLRKGCHEKKILEEEGKVSFKKTVFEHKPHLMETREEIKLRCTSCHSQIVQGEHMKVTESTCFLCHFPSGEVKEPISGCPSCHEAPKGVVKIDDREVEHDNFLKIGIDCARCHTSILSGKGEVPLQICILCHDVPERVERYDDVNFVHTRHVSEHNVECQRCHLELKHELPPAEGPAVVVCGSCHDDYHAGQKAALKGTMRQIHPTCQNCHKTEKYGKEVDCQPCHREEILTLVSTWKDGLGKSRSELRSAIKKLEKVKDEDIQSLLQEVKSSANALKEEELIHNVRFVNSQILSIYQKLQEGFSRKGLEFESRHLQVHKLLSESPCFSCHFGMETKRLKYSDREFLHTPHITVVEMECSSCHDTSAELEESHGKLAIEPSDCGMCH